MNYEDLENENLSAEDAKLREMCGNLKRVSAPKDFDFRLKARIAAHQPQAAKSPFLPFLKLAAPLVLVLGVFGFVVVNGLYSVDTNSVPQVAASYAEMPQPQGGDVPIPPQSNQPSIAQNRGPNANFEDEIPRNTNVNFDETLAMKDKNNFGKIFGNPKSNPTNENGGSRDSASTLPQIKQPLGFNNSNPVIQPRTNNDKENRSKVKELFEFIGIRGEFSGNVWKVQSVGKNSQAERSDILPNDIIEAVNGVSLTEIKQIILNYGTKLTIVREGNRQEIVLK